MTTTTSFKLEMANAALDAAADEFHYALTQYNNAGDAMAVAAQIFKDAFAAVAAAEAEAS